MLQGKHEKSFCPYDPESQLLAYDGERNSSVIESVYVCLLERERRRNAGAGQLIAVSSPRYFPAGNSCCHQFHSDT
ncbi:hypothetical protein Hanom_Chr12g01147801 [Helianthus anomalus]